MESPGERLERKKAEARVFLLHFSHLREGWGVGNFSSRSDSFMVQLLLDRPAVIPASLRVSPVAGLQ